MEPLHSAGHVCHVISTVRAAGGSRCSVDVYVHKLRSACSSEFGSTTDRGTRQGDGFRGKQACSRNWPWYVCLRYLQPIDTAASCCAIVSMAGVIVLSVFGWGFSHNWETFMGSAEDPADGVAVGMTCYGAAFIYLLFIIFCSCQLGVNRRYQRIQI